MHEKLNWIKSLILQEAEKNTLVGEIEESLKWGQPSFVAKNKSGTPIRLGTEKKSQTKDSGKIFGLYVNCSTNLIEQVRHIYGDTFTYDGNRAVLFREQDDIPEEALRHVINMALTYHLNK